MLIGAQAFQESPKEHAPAIILAIVPHIAAWALNLVNSTLSAAGTSVDLLGKETLAQAGVLIEALHVLGGGAILSGLILSAIVIFLIDKKFKQSIGFCLAGALLSFFGFMHAEQVGIAVSPQCALAYLCVALLIFVIEKSQNNADKTSSSNSEK